MPASLCILTATGALLGVSRLVDIGYADICQYKVHCFMCVHGAVGPGSCIALDMYTGEIIYLQL